MIKHKAGDDVPSEWYELKFNNNESLKDYPDFSMKFLVDCESEVIDGIRDLHTNIEYIKPAISINNISNVNLCWFPHFNMIYLDPEPKKWEWDPSKAYLYDLDLKDNFRGMINDCHLIDKEQIKK